MVRSKQQLLQSSGGEEKRRRHKRAGDDGCLPHPDRTNHERDQTSLSLKCQGPEVQLVPPELISMLKLKTLKEQWKRAAEVERRDPGFCRACEQEQASLALESFIRRKKTQLQFQTLTDRLNTRLSYGGWDRRGSSCKISQSPSMPLAGFGRNYLVEICGSQQPGVALATAEERGVALATDEMRGYPDKNATGTHLAGPRCPFSDR